MVDKEHQEWLQDHQNARKKDKKQPPKKPPPPPPEAIGSGTPAPSSFDPTLW